MVYTSAGIQRLIKATRTIVSSKNFWNGENEYE